MAKKTMNRLRQIILETDTIPGKVFNLSIQVLILLSLVCFSIETLPDLKEGTKSLLKSIEIITIIIFTIEYILRIVVSEKRLKYIFSFYGIIDLAAILPFYISRTIDLRSLRVFRLFRLLRIFKIVKYSKALQRLKNAFLMIKEELILFFFVTCFMIFISAMGIYYFENPAQPEVFKSIFHSMWWAVASLTTVGYGDFYPITTGGKIFTFIVLMIGLGIVAIPTGLIASAFTKTIRNEPE